ncbi:B3GN3 acetylglucosaminyltransferase, partial [Rhinopomastus cyanomelas]|nr:B3GN3 acetylglucosaminyltransferase [Rhinopomastus cyanomelas]
VLLAVGFLALCYQLYHDNQPWSHRTPSRIPPPPPKAVPWSPPSQNVSTPAPCEANRSVANISGFEELPGHVQDFLRYRHCRSFPLLLSIPYKCGGPQESPKVSLLLAIKSSPINYSRRQAIRRSWGQERTFQGASIRRVFLVGVSPDVRRIPMLNRLLRLEQRQHQDVLQWDFHDTFFNLTLKQVLFHAWLEENCPGVRFVFNGDDDVFVNTDNLVHFIAAQRRGDGERRHLMVGSVLANTGPIRQRSSKYFIPTQLQPSERYPPYCGGGGMLMSGFTARVIAREARHIDIFPIDDVYLGMCLERAGLLPSSHPGVRTAGLWVPGNSDPFDPCYYRELLLVHRFVPYETVLMWEAIHDPQLSCGKRVS